MSSSPPVSYNTGKSNFTEEYSNCVLITGGVGFIGSHCAEQLLREGIPVIVYDIFNSETTAKSEKQENANILRGTAHEYAHLGASVHIINGDINDKEKLRATIQDFGVTACIHAAGMVEDRRSVKYPEQYIEVNIRGTTTLLAALGECGVKMVVQASTRSVYGEVKDNNTYLDEKSERRPVNPYGAAKVGSDAMAHCYHHLYKMNVTLIRIFSAYGPRGRPDMIPRILIHSVVDGKPIKKFGDGTATRTWTYISDLVTAFLTALRHPMGFAEFNVGAPNSMTLNDMIACAEKTTGKKAIIEQYPVPPGDAYMVGHPNCNLIKETLGLVPSIGVEEGMRLTYEDYIKNKEKYDKGKSDLGGFDSSRPLNEQQVVAVSTILRQRE